MLSLAGQFDSFLTADYLTSPPFSSWPAFISPSVLFRPSWQYNAAMMTVQCLSIAILAILLTVGAAPSDEISRPLPNFYAVDVLADGELERRFFLDGVAGKETSAVFSSNNGTDK